MERYKYPSTSSGRRTSDASDELGDAPFSLLAVCEARDVDASDALDEAIEEYERRMAGTGDPGSGE